MAFLNEARRKVVRIELEHPETALDSHIYTLSMWRGVINDAYRASVRSTGRIPQRRTLVLANFLKVPLPARRMHLNEVIQRTD